MGDTSICMTGSIIIINNIESYKVIRVGLEKIVIAV